MSNPTRKRSVGVAIAKAAINVHDLDVYPIRYVVTPNDGSPSFVADFSDLHSGGSSRHARWKGDIVGRPDLISELMPIIFERTFNRTKRVTQRFHTALRALWRYLDDLPAHLGVKDLSEFTNLHGGLMLRDFQYFGFLSGMIIDARHRRGLPPLSWPPAPTAEPGVADVISEETARAIYKALKHEIRTIKGAWRYASSVLSTQLERTAELSPADAALFAVLSSPDDLFSRETLTRVKEADPFPEPPPPLLPREDGNPSNRGVPRSVAEAKRVRRLKNDYFRWVVPGISESNTFLLAVLLQTGWNLESALRLSLNDWIKPQPLHDRLVVLHSRKHRNNSIVTAISLIRPEYQPYQLLSSLAQANSGLRARAAALAREITRADPEEKDETLKRKKTEFEFMANSPWTFASPESEHGISCLFPWNSYKHPGQTLRALIAKHQVEIVDTSGVPLDPRQLKTSDFRDLWIGFAYARSGHHWLAGMIAAGHKTSDAIRSYLRTRRWRRHGEKQVAAFLTAFWAEIRERRIVDGATLRALVERGELTEEQRDRLASGLMRTRVGMGCTDPTDPPKQIAPDHPKGEVCAVQRCVLCWRALLFEESLDGLCRRRAELEAICRSSPWPTTLQSSNSEELEVLEANLAANFEAEEVERTTDIWRKRIISGEHRPIDQVGRAAASK